MRFLLMTLALTATLLTARAASFSFMRLAGRTNIYSDNSYALTINGWPVSTAAPVMAVTNIIITNLSAATTDLYTVPAGYRMTPSNAIVVTTTNGTGGTLYTQVKISGSYYRLSTSANVSTNGVSTFGVNNFIFEPGDTIAVTTTQIGASIFLPVRLVSTNSPLKTYRKIGIASGNNTLFTVPTGKVALPLNFDGQLVFDTGISTRIFQDSGGAITYRSIYNGQSVMVGTTSLSSGSAGSVLTLPQFVAADVFTLVSSSSDATQIAFTSVMELNSP